LGLVRLRTGHRVRGNLDVGLAGLLGAVRGRDLQPGDGLGRLPRRLDRGDLLPAVAHRVRGDPAHPDRAVGGAVFPGRDVQHRRGALVATWLGYAVHLPIVLHAIVCIIGAFVGGAVLGWLVGEIKARNGAHEVILTIMFNYVMYNLLAFMLTSHNLMQAPGQGNATAPGIDGNAMLPHVGGPPPQVGVGFLIALAAAAGTWWLLSRSTLGFEFRTVGASPSAARSAGIRVERVWVLAFLIAGGLAGLSATTIVQGQTAPLTTNSYGTYGFDGITVALLGRARPLGVVFAGLLFGALNAGGTVMEAATGVPADVTNVIEALIVLFVAAPPLIRLLFRLRGTGGAGPQAVASKGWSG